jgi:tetratricopeptide (TPR) repeat protein
VYRLQGRHAEAEPLYKRSLAIREAALGQDHPFVATSLNDLASLYQDQGRYAEAEALYRRTLSIFEKTWGPDHPEIAVSVSNVAFLALAQGDWTRGASLFRRAAAIVQRRTEREGVAGTSVGSLMAREKTSILDAQGAWDDPDTPLPFDAVRAHALYKNLFGESRI